MIVQSHAEPMVHTRAMMLVTEATQTCPKSCRFLSFLLRFPRDMRRICMIVPSAIERSWKENRCCPAEIAAESQKTAQK